MEQELDSRGIWLVILLGKGDRFDLSVVVDEHRRGAK